VFVDIVAAPVKIDPRLQQKAALSAVMVGHAAAAAVGARHARKRLNGERPAPGRAAMHGVEGMVAKQRRALERQEVLVLQVALRQVHVQSELADRSLKLKFRMNGMTHLKSKALKARIDGARPLDIDFDTVGSSIYEGGDELRFDLCQPCQIFGSSEVLASSQMSLAEALASLEVGGSRKKVFKLEMMSSEAPVKALANLALEISLRSSSLYAAGGIAALKMTSVPSQSASGYSLGDISYPIAQRHLQAALKTAMEATGNTSDCKQVEREARHCECCSCDWV
jgi:hypothetical protein